MSVLNTIPKDRLFTGLALLVVAIIIGLIDNFYLTWAVLGVVYLLAFKESMKLFDVKDNTLLLYAMLLWLSAAVFSGSNDLFILAGIVYASIVAYKRDVSWKPFLPFIYPTAGMLFILTLYQEYGVKTLLWLIVVVALSDVGAYAIGKSVGKTPFSPTSPNKTLEGVIGGLAVATIGGMFMGLIIVDLKISFIISALVSLSTIFGDLYESHLKRRAGVKDSGNILPGHGGILDRIDGYLFASIVMLIFLRGLV